MTTELMGQAKKNKEDEFYTQLSDIEAEMRHYKKQFNGKTILCNCDDPYESNFFAYFAMNFNFLGLKKLIATCYVDSPIAGNQLSLFDVRYLDPPATAKKEPHKIEITEVIDYNADGAIDYVYDVAHLIKNKNNTLTRLKGDGSFRSEECIEILKQADIVVTNPPFSQFREYIALLEEHNKNFLIIGNTNALTYKEVFKLIEADRIRTGYTNFNVGMYFYVPDFWEEYHKIENGKKLVRVSTSCWFTNLEVQKHKEPITLYKNYTPEEYPHYDNFDAIEVPKYADIPCDWDGVMGVPITFLDKYCPDQFQIVGITKTWYGGASKTYPPQVQVNANGTKSKRTVTKLNDGATLKLSTPPVGKTYYIVEDEYYIQLYARILIKRRTTE